MISMFHNGGSLYYFLKKWLSILSLNFWNREASPAFDVQKLKVFKKLRWQKSQ